MCAYVSLLLMGVICIYVLVPRVHSFRRIAVARRCRKKSHTFIYSLVHTRIAFKLKEFFAIINQHKQRVFFRFIVAISNFDSSYKIQCGPMCSFVLLVDYG